MKLFQVCMHHSHENDKHVNGKIIYTAVVIAGDGHHGDRECRRL